MSNDQANQNNATETQPAMPSGTLPDWPTFEIPEEFLGGIQEIEAIEQRQNASRALRTPVSALPPLPFLKT